MKLRQGAVLLGVVCALAWTAARAEDAKFGGAFNVKAITGENKGKTLCYV